VKFMIEYPIHSDVEDGAWIDPANMAAFARAAEDAGIDGIALTDHPAPSQKWLDGGGHETFDPFAGLSFFAAVTSRLAVMTYLTVVPYRNPFLTAKSMASVDVLSGGRSIFVLGTGYLRSEFAALGVDFDERNELFDEAAEVLQGIFTTPNFSYQGRHFKAVGQTLVPNVVQRPHPPLWIGGNAKVVLQRVARWAQGWAPLGGSPTLARTARTRNIADAEELATMIARLGDMLEEQGRGRRDVDICVSNLEVEIGPGGAQERLDEVAARADMGVTWSALALPRTSFPASLEALSRFGDEVITPLRR